MSWKQVQEHLDIRMRQNAKRNTITVSTNESLAHFMLKAQICHQLRQNEKEFYTEAIFAGGKGRADIYVIDKDGNYAIEIVHTEDVLKTGKHNKYPVPIIFHYTTGKGNIGLGKELDALLRLV